MKKRSIETISSEQQAVETYKRVASALYSKTSVFLTEQTTGSSGVDDSAVQIPSFVLVHFYYLVSINFVFINILFLSLDKQYHSNQERFFELISASLLEHRIENVTETMSNFDSRLANMKARLDSASNCVEEIQAQGHNFFLSHQENAHPRPAGYALTKTPVYESEEESDNDGESSSYRERLVEG